MGDIPGSVILNFMGNEYKIRFEHEDEEELDSLLRVLPHFADFNIERRYYNYRMPDNLEGMPNAVIQIEADGLYFCDFLMPQDMLNQVTAIVKRKYGNAHIEDYES